MCYRRETLESIQLDAVQLVGYAFQIEMKLRAKRNGHQVKEVPTTFVDRELGTSKMSMNIFREALLGVLQMRFKRIFFQHRPTNARNESCTLFRNAHVVNDGAVTVQDVLIDGERILACGVDLVQRATDAHIKAQAQGAQVKDCTGLWLMPGCIEDKVHYREPGLKHNAEIATESAAAAAGASLPSWKCPTPCPSR